MSSYLLEHRHEADDCPVVFASWRGFSSPLRHRVTFASCAMGGHRIWWRVEAAHEAEALSYLPTYVADRTAATQIADLQIP